VTRGELTEWLDRHIYGAKWDIFAVRLASTFDALIAEHDRVDVARKALSEIATRCNCLAGCDFADDPSCIARRALRQLDPCPHSSSSGIDETPLDDPAKVWRCDQCGWLHRTEMGPDGFAHDVEAADA